MMGKAYAITLSDSDSSNSDSDESCDGEGNYSAFMTIAYVMVRYQKLTQK